jgi:putative ABC transport system ATP-binding protein
MTDAISLKGVSKLYRRGPHEVAALYDVNLSVEKGAFFTVSGPSGSGKTTLLNILGGLDLPSSGEIAVEGERIDKKDEHGLARYRRSRVGFVFQENNLLLSLTASENIELPLLLAGRKGQRAQVLELLDEVGLGGKEDALPSSLSTGEQQRVAVARAIVHVPSILLADEPTASLDSETGDGILALLDTLRRERKVTVVLATHDPRITSRNHPGVRLRDGRIAEDKGD